MEDEDIELVKALDDNGKLTQNPTTSKNDTSAGKMKWTGKTCLILAVLIATIAILVFAVLVAIIIVNPQARELNTEIQTLKQQVENLRIEKVCDSDSAEPRHQQRGTIRKKC